MRVVSLLALLVCLLASPVRAQRAGDIVITEVMVNPAGGFGTTYEPSGEWFELYNATTQPIDLQGWYVRDANAQVDSQCLANLTPHRIATSLVVPPHGFVVLGRTTDPALNGGVPEDYSYGTALSLSNAIDAINVIAPDGETVISGACYRSAAAAQDGISRERLSLSINDPNIDGNNWAYASENTVYGGGGRGTPKQAGQTAGVAPASNSSSVATSAVAGFRLLAPPVGGLTVGTLAGLNLVQGISDEFPAGFPNLFTGYTGTATGPTRGYTVPASKSTYLLSGRGFLWYMYTAGGPGPNATAGTSRRAELPVELYAPGFPITADFTATFQAAERGASADQFYLLGNPFDTAFDLSGIAVSSGTLSNVFQLYDPATGYVLRTRIADEYDNSDDVSTWQGFFAEFTAAPTLPVTVTYAAGYTFTSPQFVGRPATAAAVRQIGLVLDGVTTSGVAAHDEAATLYFADEATADWDSYDASKLTPPSGVAATLAPVGPGMDGAMKELAQRSLPYSLLGDVTVPVSFTATEAGTFTISAATFDGVPALWSVTLTDAATGATTVLTEGASYAFTSDATDASERFSVTIRPGGATAQDGSAGVEAYALTAVSPNPSVAGARTMLQVRRAQTVRADVYDVLGRLVQTAFDGAVASGTSQVLTVAPGLPSGTYVLRVTGADFATTRTFSVAR